MLAAGVAHEVNTPLTGISSYTQMLLEQADPDDPRTPLLEKIEKQTFRAARIVNGLLNLSRSSAAEASERTIVDLNAVIGDVLSLLEHQFDRGSIKVRREFSAEAVPVIGFEFKLQQVFLNLFLNARDAMASGGWLTIATRLEGHEAVAEVSDTGTGVAPSIWRASTIRSSRPRRAARAPVSDCRLPTASCASTKRRFSATARLGQGTRFELRFAAAPASATAQMPRQSRAGSRPS